MIKDTLHHLSRYFLNKNFEKFKEELKTRSSLPVTLPEPFKAVQLEYSTTDWDYDKFETHRKYIDVHVIIEGVERVGLNYTEELEPMTEYDGLNDYQLFRGMTRDEFVLQKEDFIVLFPGEAHLTGGRIKQKQKVKKIVYKIPIM